MLKKINLFAIIIALFSTVSIFAQTEEGFEAANSSNLTKVSLPSNALRMSADKVPGEISQTLDRFIEAGEGKVQKGDSEVLAWTGGKETTINRLIDTLKVAGWKYEVGGTENGITIFSLLKEGAKRRAIMGFYGKSEGILVLAWVELLPTDSASNSNQDTERTEVSPSSNGNIVGAWDNGRVSTLNRQNTITGAISPSGGTRFEYQFTANGRFSFTGLANTTTYGCRDTLYNEKAGSYILNGSTLTLNPTNNFWEKTSSCGANSERNYTLAKEVYQVSFKINEYNQELFCLSNSNGEACYRRKQ